MGTTKRAAVLMALTAAAVMAGAVSAHATPGKSSPCTNCHGGPSMSVSVTEVANNGTTASYHVSATGADAFGVFDGSTKIARIDGASGDFSVSVGKTYNVYAVNGPSTSSGVGVKSVTPAAADAVAPVTVSDAQSSYATTATVNLLASDAGGSGVSATYYRLNGGLQTAGTTVVVGGQGTHTLEFWSVDKSGNVETPHKFATFTVGLVAPATVNANLGASTVAYGGTTTLKGQLRSTWGIPGKTVVVQTSTDNRVWRSSSAVLVTSATGSYSVKVTAKTRTHYRVVFAGDSQYGSTISPSVALTPRVYLTRPTAPTRIARGKSFTSYGYLKPRHASGTYPIKIKAYRYQSGKWVLRKTVSAKASNYSSYTKYTKRFSLPYRGKWRIRSYHAADSKNATTYSSYRYVTVN